MMAGVTTPPPPGPQPTYPTSGYQVPASYGQPGYGPPAYGQPGYGPYGQAPPPFVPVPTSPAGEPLAPFDKRLVAHIIDSLIVGGVAAVIVIPIYVCSIFLVFRTSVGTNGEITSTSSFLFGFAGIFLAIIVLSALLTYVYYVELALRGGGQTFGKRTMKIRIVPLEPGVALTRRHLALRFLATYGMSLVPGLQWVDGLFQLWDKPYQQCLHDKAAKTVVVRLPG